MFIRKGGGSGATTLSALTDTSISSPSNGQILGYNGTTGKWENQNPSGGVAESVVGPVESGTTASQAYAVGEHFIRNDKFCTCISAIASGATLTQGTNYVEGTIAENITKRVNYSATEHVVGKWIDGSNIYEITADQGSSEMSIPTITGGGWGNSNISNANIKAILSAWGVSNSGTLWGLNGNCDTGNYCQFCLERDGGGTSAVRYITIQYLKKS